MQIENFKCSNSNGYSIRQSALFFVLSLMILSLLTTACQTTEKAISLDEARQISLEYQDRSFTPPPRTISDLEKELRVYTGGAKCNSEPVEMLTKQEVFDTLGGEIICKTTQACNASKLFRRAEFLVSMGHFSEAITYIDMAIGTYPGYRPMYLPKAAVCYAYLGDFNAASQRVGSSAGFGGTAAIRVRAKRNYYATQAAIHKIKGQYLIAEANIREAIKVSENSLVSGISMTERIYQLLIERIELAEILMLQGRLLEAEVALRDVMTHPISREPVRKSRAALVLSQIYFKQGRYKDAERVANTAVDAFIASEAHCSSLYLNVARHVIARSRTAMGQWPAALNEFDVIRQNMVTEPELFYIRFDGDPDWILALIGSGRLDKAKAMIEIAFEKNRAMFSRDKYAVAEIQGLDAVNHVLRGDKSGALKLFTACAPVLISKRVQPGADTGSATAFNQRRAFILEYYMELLADMYAKRLTTPKIQNPATEAFQLAEVIRGSSVKQAVGALSARIASGNADLADLVRREQDTGKQINALRSVLYNAFSQPEKNYDIINDLNMSITELSSARKAIKVEIEDRFPDYANLTNPKPTAIANIQEYLKADEALIAFYVGSHRTFVWGISGAGPVAFASIAEGRSAIKKRVDHIREALDPETATLGGLPEFDIAAAHDLYQRFFDPVKPGWQQARHLTVVPHGPLGHLPPSLLPTGKVRLKNDPGLFLAEYRSIPWLIRNHTITVIPSADVLITLRKMPAGETGRKAFAGFGDPLFSANQLKSEDDATNQPVTRGIGKNYPSRFALHTRAIRITKNTTLDDNSLNTASLDMLQPLPDTRAELLSIANALQADPRANVFTGKAASEKLAKSGILSNRRVLVFATHGLVSGDLDGLHQPALALSNPALADDGKNDGLLTMGEIMGLRLDADWVVLSACNTAAGDGAGAEAASGLGRAFFYAGTRAILLSNWPVESRSAKLLTTDLFKRQAASPGMSRAQALRASMLNLLDKGIYRDLVSGKPLFAYAHPIFWAPFMIIGNGS